MECKRYSSRDTVCPASSGMLWQALAWSKKGTLLRSRQGPVVSPAELYGCLGEAVMQGDNAKRGRICGRVLIGAPEVLCIPM